MTFLVFLVILGLAASVLTGYVLWPRQGKHKCDAGCRADAEDL